DWDPQKGHELYTTEEHFPGWYSRSPVNLPLKEPVQYKYVSMDVSGKEMRWESFEGNREIIPTGDFMTIEDDDGLYRLKAQTDLSIATYDDENRETSAKSKMEAARSRYEDLLQKDVTFEDNNTVLICSMELPLRVTRTASGSFSVEDRKSALLPSLYALHLCTPRPCKFFGWPGIHLKSQEEQEELTLFLEKYNCIPIFPSDELFSKYLEFCHRFLWPLFHNVLSLSLDLLEPFTTDLWNAYKYINRLWADKISIYAHERDLIWIHDFYLLVLPMFLKRRVRKSNIGLFLHIPFPSNEVFRCIPMRDELLNGMLFSDLIGFHIYEYASNFFAACAYLSGYEQRYNFGGGLSLQCDGHDVIVHVSHVHIQYDEVRKKCDNSKLVQEMTKEMREQFKDKFIFASVDRCERLAGLLHKVRAFVHFLRNYPKAQGAAVLIQYAYPMMSNWDEPKSLEIELQEFVDNANKEFAHLTNKNEKVIYLHIREVSWMEKYSLFQAADCFFNTSIRDGFNLNPLEFICCRKDQPAALILSEFIGCTRSLTSALRCNPWKIDNVAALMDRAMSLSLEEVRTRFENDQKFLQHHSTKEWARQFLKSEILAALPQSRRRFFFFDYEGTLAYDRRRINALPLLDEGLFSKGISPLEEVKHTLLGLLRDSKNTVVILSGRDPQHLEEWFGDVEGLGLCAEHGFYYKLQAITNDKWHCVSQNVDFSWKELVLEILNLYVDRTQGSFVENKVRGR
ncbi:trehalose-phosphatase, partial [Cardiosporidium cionae]